jgi:hypothetical protein
LCFRYLDFFMVFLYCLFHIPLQQNLKMVFTLRLYF